MRTDALSFMSFDELRQRDAWAVDRSQSDKSDAYRAEIDRRWAMMYEAARHVNERVCCAFGEDAEDAWMENWTKQDMDQIEACIDAKLFSCTAHAASMPSGASLEWMRELSADRIDALGKWSGIR
jgi:hypothetical protein